MKTVKTAFGFELQNDSIDKTTVSDSKETVKRYLSQMAALRTLLYKTRTRIFVIRLLVRDHEAAPQSVRFTVLKKDIGSANAMRSSIFSKQDKTNSINRIWFSLGKLDCIIFPCFLLLGF